MLVRLKGGYDSQQRSEYLEIIPGGDIPEVRYMCDGNLLSVVLATDCSRIGDRAFSHSGVHSIGDGVEEIGNNAFQMCKNITVVPPMVQHIGNSAFWGCENLRKLILEFEGVILDSGAFEKCRNLVSVSLPAKADVRNCAFVECVSLEKVTIGTDATIGEGAFKDCGKLGSVSLSARTSVKDSAFRRCGNLKDVTIGAETTIDRLAFEECQSMKLRIRREILRAWLLLIHITTPFLGKMVLF